MPSTRLSVLFPCKESVHKEVLIDTFVPQYLIVGSKVSCGIGGVMLNKLRRHSLGCLNIDPPYLAQMFGINDFPQLCMSCAGKEGVGIN